MFEFENDNFDYYYPEVRAGILKTFGIDLTLDQMNNLISHYPKIGHDLENFSIDEVTLNIIAAAIGSLYAESPWPKYGDEQKSIQEFQEKIHNSELTLVNGWSISIENPKYK